jgi:hypothetical protein
MSDEITKRYMVCNSENLLNLEWQVSTMMADGWKPQGGLAVESGPEVVFFMQAMVKIDD